MATDTDGVLTQTPLEARASIENLDALQARRRGLVERHKKLIALHGPFGHYDDHRKRMVEAQKIKARMDLTIAGEGKKPTEDQITAAAYGGEEYGKFIDEALSERIEYVTIGNEIDEINERIRSREEEMRTYRGELGLGG